VNNKKSPDLAIGGLKSSCGAWQLPAEAESSGGGSRPPLDLDDTARIDRVACRPGNRECGEEEHRSEDLVDARAVLEAQERGAETHEDEEGGDAGQLHLLFAPHVVVVVAAQLSGPRLVVEGEDHADCGVRQDDDEADQRVRSTGLDRPVGQAGHDDDDHHCQPDTVYGFVVLAHVAIGGIESIHRNLQVR
jgi:hypothetical protein